MDHGDDTRKKPNEYTKCHQTEYLKIVKLVKFMSWIFTTIWKNLQVSLHGLEI